MAAHVVRVELCGAVLTLTVTNPPVNALSVRVIKELTAALEDARRTDVRVLVLTADGGRAFCAGMDLRERADVDAAEHASRSARVRELIEALRAFPVPTVCAVNGPAVGVGIGLMFACDYRIADPAASFSLPEIARGTVADAGLSLRAAGVPAGPTRALLFTGKPMSCDVALRVHLVDEVCGPGRLAERVLALTDDVSAHPAAALRVMKDAILRGEAEPDRARAFRVVGELSDRYAESAYGAESVRAFLDSTNASSRSELHRTGGSERRRQAGGQGE